MKDDLKSALDKAKEKRLKSILRMYAKGKSTDEVAKSLDITRQRVHQICKAGGHSIPRKGASK